MGGKSFVELFMGHPHAVIMPQTNQGKFYPLQVDEWLDEKRALVENKPLTEIVSGGEAK